MKVGVPKEIKTHENRVGPGARQRSRTNAEWSRGYNRGIRWCWRRITDAVFEEAGARIVAGADEIFSAADMVVKVKEPQKVERKKLRPGQILFTYLHLAPDPGKRKIFCPAARRVSPMKRSRQLMAPCRF